MQVPVAGPQGGACRQLDGGEEMRIDISDAEAEQGVAVYEMQHFLFCRNAGLRPPAKRYSRYEPWHRL